MLYTFSFCTGEISFSEMESTFIYHITLSAGDHCCPTAGEIEKASFFGLKLFLCVWVFFYLVSLGSSYCNVSDILLMLPNEIEEKMKMKMDVCAIHAYKYIVWKHLLSRAQVA